MENFDYRAEMEEFSETSQSLAETVESVIKKLQDNFSQKTDYLKFLVESFQKKLGKLAYLKIVMKYTNFNINLWNNE